MVTYLKHHYSSNPSPPTVKQTNKQMVWIEEETFIFYNEDSQTEEQVAQRGCAVSIEGFQDAQSPQQPGLISSLIMV